METPAENNVDHRLPRILPPRTLKPKKNQQNEKIAKNAQINMPCIFSCPSYVRIHTSTHLVVPDEDMAVVESAEHPGLGGVDVDALDAIRPRGQELLDLQPKRLGDNNTTTTTKNDEDKIT